MKRALLWWGLSALLLASAACGGSGGDSPEAKADNGAASSSSTSSGKDGGGGPASGGAAGGGAAAPDGSAPSTGGDGATATTSRTSGGGGKGADGSDATVTRTASLDRACVRQGVAADVQGLTVRNMKPGEHMAYATVYSDGSTKFSNRSYETGEGSGKAGPDGVYRATWVVPATAPLGQATVRLVTFEQVEPMDLAFTIVGPQEACP